MLISQLDGDAVPVSLRAPTGLYRNLFDALRFVASDLSLRDVQRRLVVAACQLVAARDGALAILGCHGQVVHVVHLGRGRELVEAVQRGSEGAQRHSVVPIEVGGRHHATLHVAATDAPTDDDLVLLRELAAAAATAIDNARRHDEARRSRDWLNASGDIARALLADADADMLLDVVSRALHVAEADLGSLILPAGDGDMRVAVSVGVGSSEWKGATFTPSHSAVGRAIVRGESLLVPDLMPLAAEDYVNVHRYGPTMLAPLVDAKGVRGAVVLIRLTGRATFTPHELELATTFADQVALALELNDMRATTEALRALQDRHRIAQDLHDNVIQRLFATGVGLQGLASGRALAPEAVEKLRRHIADLDETIDEIRDTVFGLRSGTPTDAMRAQARFQAVPAAPGDR